MARPIGTFSMTGRVAGETAAQYTRRASAHIEYLEEDRYPGQKKEWRPFGGGQALFLIDDKHEDMVAYVNTDQMK